MPEGEPNEEGWTEEGQMFAVPFSHRPGGRPGKRGIAVSDLSDY